MSITISCTEDLRNFFTRAQHVLDKEFAIIEGVEGVWAGKIRSGGAFPVGSGWAARTTILGFNRPRVTGAPKFQPLVGLQTDCATSCNSPARTVNLGNADHKWYRMTEYAENTEAFCLKSMWGDALNLPAQIKNHVRNLKARTHELMDEFDRANYAAISDNKWLGVDGIQPRRQLWRFEEDVNGTVNVNKVIIDAGVDPNDISLLTQEYLNYVRLTGTYNGAFSKQGPAPIITDYETMSEIPKQDTNTRADNRYRSPEKLDPALGAVQSYGNWDYTFDPFCMRYFWDLNDPNYPNGVMTRIDQWTANPVSEGCMDEVSSDYLEADFQISLPFNPEVYLRQTLNLPTNLPEMNYSQPASPYTGMWRFINENDPVTPCNTDRNMAYWRMVMDMAAKPQQRFWGHAIFHRRYNRTGTIKSCRSLVVPVGAYYDCSMSCAPFDFFPPALVSRTTCGAWNPAGGTCAG